MVTLGSDPHKSRDWTEYEVRRSPKKEHRTTTNRDLYDLVNYFAYHPHMKMSQRMNDTDKMVLATFLSKKLDVGVTVASLKSMMDKYYQSWGADSECPALTFVSTKMQEKLTSEGMVVIAGDPVLTWLLDGMPDDGPFDDPKALRKAVLLRGGDLSVRYPSLLAEILYARMSLEDTEDMLEQLNDLVRWNLGDKNVSVDPHSYRYKHIGRHVNIPAKLLGRHPKPTAVAKAYPSVAIAAANIRTYTPRKKKD